MTNIVINAKHGGFSLSERAIDMYLDRKGKKYYKVDHKYSRSLGPQYWLVPLNKRPADRTDEWYTMSLEERCAHNKAYSEAIFNDRDIPRDDLDLIAVVTILKDKANGAHAELKVVSIPSDVEWEIKEYDGREWVAEKHRTWS